MKLRDADFRTRRASRTLEAPVIGDRVIFETARELLVKLRRALHVPVRLLGISLTSLDEAAAGAQLALLVENPHGRDTERDRALARSVDAVRAKYGRAAIVPGVLAGTQRRGRATKPND